MVKLAIERESDVPLYRQLANQLRTLIRTGSLPPGARLPPVREVAAELGLTRLTVHSAYAELQAQGLTEAVVGRGTFVAADARTGSTGMVVGAVPPPTPWLSQSLLAELTPEVEAGDLLTLSSAHPAAETFPVRELGRAIQETVADPLSLGYGPVAGEMALREQIATLLLERGIVTPPEHVLITAGAQQGIDLAIRSLTMPGDVVVVEEPTYPGVLEVAAQRRQPIVGVPFDEDGLSIDALAAICQSYHPRMVYTVSTFHNPTGLTLASGRRRDLLRLADEHDFLLVEDDTYGFLGLHGDASTPLKAHDEEHRVIYITSFSKMVSPSLRLGAIVASPRYLPRLAAAKQGSDLVCSSLLQRTLATYLRQGALPSHLERVRAIYRQREEALDTSLRRFAPACTWTRPAGGLNLWVTLPDGVEEADVYREALAQGVTVARGQMFYPEPQRVGHLRLSFGNLTPGQIVDAVAILGHVIQRQQGRRMWQRGQTARPLG
ncbi:MAG: MocR-like pyridoxine biosynthesis transcription factor PdxR [Ktedonobacterales bacterium]